VSSTGDSRWLAAAIACAWHRCLYRGRYRSAWRLSPLRGAPPHRRRV